MSGRAGMRVAHGVGRRRVFSRGNRVSFFLLLMLMTVTTAVLQPVLLRAEEDERERTGVPGDKLGTGLVRRGTAPPTILPKVKPDAGPGSSAGLDAGNLDINGGPAQPPMPARVSRTDSAPPVVATPEKRMKRAKATGTGFFITGTGYLVTNYHVVEGGRRFQVIPHTQKPLAAQVVAQDKKADLAILKVEVEDHACLPVVTSRGVRLGTSVATVGFPNIGVQGHAPKLAKGEIAALSGIQDDPGRFQISVPLQPGNSGGALVDARGNVVGVVAAILNQKVALETSGALATNVAYAVKSSLLLSLMESVPGLEQQLAEPRKEAKEFVDVVEDVERAAALILVE